MKLVIPNPPFNMTALWRANKLPGAPVGLPAKRVARRLRELGYARKTVRVGGVVVKAWVLDNTQAQRARADKLLDKLL